MLLLNKEKLLKLQNWFHSGSLDCNTHELRFRLTRDVVDGMGISGSEGVFRRCCEETMRILRARHSALLTILEVFIHDPLYRWALDPLAVQFLLFLL